MLPSPSKELDNSTQELYYPSKDLHNFSKDLHNFSKELPSKKLIYSSQEQFSLYKKHPIPSNHLLTLSKKQHFSSKELL